MPNLLFHNHQKARLSFLADCRQCTCQSPSGASVGVNSTQHLTHRAGSTREQPSLLVQWETVLLLLACRVWTQAAWGRSVGGREGGRKATCRCHCDTAGMRTAAALAGSSLASRSINNRRTSHVLAPAPSPAFGLFSLTVATQVFCSFRRT